jgi:hypothetical protein
MTLTARRQDRYPLTTCRSLVGRLVFDDQGRHTAMLDGYQPGDPMVAVFAYQAQSGRPAQEIADEASDIFNDHPRDAAGAELAWAYYGRKLRSLSFPGKRPCCPRSCCGLLRSRVIRITVDPASWREIDGQAETGPVCLAGSVWGEPLEGLEEAADVRC